MKVLILTNMYPTPEKPAFGTFVRTQVESLRRSGIDVEVLALDGDSRKLIYPKGLVQLHRRLRRGDIDVLHAHYSYTGMVGRLQRRVPLVVTFHGSDLIGSFGPGGRPERSNTIVVPAGKLLARLAEVVVVQSAEMARLVPRANVHIVPHEVDFETFGVTERDEARAKLGLAPERRYLLFAAHPDNPIKNFPFAREVARRLAAEDPRVELLVVHQEPQARLALYLSAADALIFPSYAEGSPNVVKQAMACNLPIVATPVGDIREVIAGTDWCFVRELDERAYVTALRDILAERARTTGRQAVQRFAPEIVVEQLTAVYREALAKGVGRRAGAALREGAD